jgi:hypothetical protein
MVSSLDLDGATLTCPPLQQGYLDEPVNPHEAKAETIRLSGAIA